MTLSLELMTDTCRKIKLLHAFCILMAPHFNHVLVDAEDFSHGKGCKEMEYVDSLSSENMAGNAFCMFRRQLFYPLFDHQ